MRVNNNRILITLLLILWVVSWTSLPGVGGAHSISDVDAQFHKLVAKAILFSLILFVFLVNRRQLEMFIKDAKPFLIYIVLNVLLLVLSANIFYSFTRLVDFSLMVATSFLIVSCVKDGWALRPVISYTFYLLTLYLLVALLVFWAIPEWGAIGAGFNAAAQDYTYRLGGVFIRVDAAAALAGACLTFWIFDSPKGRSYKTIIKLSGGAISIAVLVLSYSRSVMIATTVACLYVYFRRRKMSSANTWVVLFLLFGGIAVFHEEIIGFYIRHESLENIQTASGRLDIAVTLFQVNSWHNILIGNGYSMHSPAGLYIPVEELGQDMSSAHNGYLSVLFGSGVVGMILCLWVQVRIYQKIMRIEHTSLMESFRWAFPCYLLLTISTFFDYGVWGTASPSLMVFTIIYFASMKYSIKSTVNV